MSVKSFSGSIVMLAQTAGMIRDVAWSDSVSCVEVNCDRNSDHRAWHHVSSFVMEKYSRFLWSVTTSIGSAEPSR